MVGLRLTNLLMWKKSEEVLRLLFLTLCLLYTVDTHLFIYPSLSRTLMPASLIVLISAIVIVVLVYSQAIVYMNSLMRLLFVWILYLIFHQCFIPCERYYLFLHIDFLFLAFILCLLLQNKQLTRRDIENGLLIVLYCNLLYITIQLTGLVDSPSSSFSITGASDNVNLTAIYIAGCVPLLYSRIEEGNRGHWISLVLVFVIIVFLKCRTAFIGCGIDIFVMLLMSDRIRTIFKKTNFRLKVILSIFLAGVVIGLGIFLYNIKKDSANGRIFVWRQSLEMSASRPMGYGYGLFEREYNLHQSQYFLSGLGTDTERHNAEYTTKALNDYLEHCVCGGWIGMLLLVLFYTLSIKKSWQNRDRTALAIFLSFSIMSLTYFITSSIQPWLLVICYAAIVWNKESCKLLPIYSQIVLITFLVLTTYVGFREIKVTIAQIKLAQYKEQMKLNKNINDQLFANLESDIETSEGYWQTRGINLLRQYKFVEANRCYREAIRYTSAPSLHYRLYEISKLQGHESTGIEHILYWYGLEPLKLSPKLLLMLYSDRKNDKRVALRYAHEIISTPIKVHNQLSEEIQNNARLYIEENGNNRTELFE